MTADITSQHQSEIDEMDHMLHNIEWVGAIGALILLSTLIKIGG